MNIQTKDAQIQTLTNQKNQLQTWLDDNTTSISSLNTQISGLNKNITSLQSDISTIKAPKLIQINLLSTDNRAIPSSSYLNIIGQICNVGTNMAYNCKFYVVAYSGGLKVIDTYVTMGSGTIAGEYFVNVNTNVWYTGSALDSWTVTPQWTTS
jgi:hypothetical protein